MDKLGAGIQGDPSSALLEVLDPEQNATFRDNYLAVPFDLSHVMFIGTANVLDAIPGPLRDRMEVIELPGYTEDEKLEIARRYLVRRQLTANGLTPEMGSISDDALRVDHPRLHPRGRLPQPGARDRRPVPPRRRPHRRGRGDQRPHRRRRCRRHARAPPLRERGGPAHQRRRRRHRPRLDARRRRHPVHRGHAGAGQGPADPHRPARRRHEGERPGRPQPGQVQAVALGLDPELFEKSDIHVHVPAGAIPKDGPSAGVAMFIALASLLTDRAVRGDLAMTGEISLRGLVLPVGGIKEKVVAAARAGLRTVMLPMRNKKDLEDVPASAQAALEFRWIEHVDEAVEIALGLKPTRRPESPTPAAPADGSRSRGGGRSDAGAAPFGLRPEAIEIGRQHRLQIGGLDAEIIQGESPVRDDVVAAEQLHLIAGQRRRRQLLQEPALNLGQAQRQRQQQPVAGDLAEHQLHALTETEDARATELVGLAAGRRVGEDSQEGVGHVADVDRLKLGLEHRQIGEMRVMPANLLKKASSGPNTIDGRTILAPGNSWRIACSPPALVRAYSAGESRSAPIADMCTSRATPASRAARATLAAPSTWTF